VTAGDGLSRCPDLPFDGRGGAGQASLETEEEGRTEGHRLSDTILADVRMGVIVGHPATFSRGEVVFHEGDPGDTLHVVVEGMFAVRVATPAGFDLVVDVINRGQVFGELAVFSPEGRRTTAISALTEGETIGIRGDALRARVMARPELAVQLIEMIIERINDSRRRMTEVVCIPASQRVLRALVNLTRPDMGGSQIRLTQHDLASFAATTRPTANRVLRDEVRRGTLEIARGRVRVIDRAELTRRAGLDREDL
jgi:CRP/FNR family cyclic AMP-dependent transcriptional regulator